MRARPDVVGDGSVHLRHCELSVAGGVVPVRIYTPRHTPSVAALLWIHGGGFVGGGLRMGEADAVSRTFARTGVVVVSVGYRLVPPLPRARRWFGKPAVRFPVPVNDCHAGWYELVREAAAENVPAGRLFVGGASAGGNLAVMSTLRASAAGLARPAGVLLAYPLLHADWAGSAGAFAVRDRVTRVAVRWMARCFVGTASVSRLEEAFPQSDELSDFPPTVVVTGDTDGLRPSGEAFADDLRRHGVAVQISAEPGTGHGHLNHPGTPAFDRTLSTLTSWLHQS